MHVYPLFTKHSSLSESACYTNQAPERRNMEGKLFHLKCLCRWFAGDFWRAVVCEEQVSNPALDKGNKHLKWMKGRYCRISKNIWQAEFDKENHSEANVTKDELFCLFRSIFYSWHVLCFGGWPIWSTTGPLITGCQFWYFHRISCPHAIKEKSKITEQNL